MGFPFIRAPSWGGGGCITISVLGGGQILLPALLGEPSSRAPRYVLPVSVPSGKSGTKHIRCNFFML